MIPHQGIVNQIRWRLETFPLEPSDRVFQTIALSFDPSVWQIFWPLSCGAQLVLAEPQGQKDPAYLVQTIAQQHISVIALVPSLLRVFLEMPGIGACTDLKYVFCGGEALPRELVERFFQVFKGKRILYNVYGPTEASIDATYWRCEADTLPAISPIGYPIRNTQIYVLNNDLEVLPVGEEGEIYIGGMGLARGYLNRPELTHDKFIPSPFAATAAAKLYRTGDLGRWRSDGALEFLGRIDHQVKIRGFRIELGEIEVALTSFSAIAEAVVLAHKSSTGEQQLVAYLTCPPNTVSNRVAQAPAVEELRDFLKQKLPDYMVPSFFIFLDKLPLNSNGKIDRRALPDPDQIRLEREIFVAPTTPLEQQIASVWTEFLELERVGVHDNLFNLGGNSLLAVQTAAALEQKLGQTCPVTYFFQQPTVSGLAEQFQSMSGDVLHPSLFPIQVGASPKILFCVHVLGPKLQFYRPLASHLENYTLYGLASALSGDPEAPHPQDIKKLATYYIKVMKMVQPEGPYYMVGVSFGGHIVYEIAQQLVAQGDRVGLLGLLDSGCPMQFRRYAFQRFLRHLQNIKRQGFEYIWEKLLRLKSRLEHLQPGLSKQDHPHGQLYKVDAKALPAHTFLKPEEHDTVNHHYRFIPYPGVITLFRAEYDPDAKLNWRNLAEGGLVIHEIPGDHLGILAEPHVQVLGQKLREILQ
jgi:thioesterase domain-containing protein/acyl carrier protein